MRIPDNVRTFLMSTFRFPVLATVNPDGTIHQSVMWFDLEGDTVLMNTAKGRVKHRNMSANNHVSLCFEEAGAYVTLSGRVEMIDEQARAKGDIHRLAVRYEGNEVADQQSRDVYANQERVTLLVTVDKILSQGLTQENG
jgi:PPOX class probable F420-dependent enzyme